MTRKSSNDSAKKTPGGPRKSSIPTLANSSSGRKPATPSSSSSTPGDEERRKKLAEFKNKMRKERDQSNRAAESNEDVNGGGEVMSDIVVFNGSGDKQRLRA